MLLCKVTGTVVATRQREVFRPCKILIVRKIDKSGTLLPAATDLLALDPKFSAGVGDIVLVATEGHAVADVLGRKRVPANAVVVGVVDDWHLAEKDLSV